jgi:hypothetical protein
VMLRVAITALGGCDVECLAALETAMRDIVGRMRDVGEVEDGPYAVGASSSAGG